ncbi:sterol desaturase family protein [Flaviaesturariibacter flavus]|uniref:Sterol desaturase family protein n=2 Tax=Flaviaesturariibacter flavus TaxID=2502780 RepID=A0A4V2NV99_9BACT|nr:sterol desaturase family protein [Flaviaesturariibacter flavus]
MFLVVIGRYLLIAGIFHGVFYVWQREKWRARKINGRPHKPGQYRREVSWSTVTALLFAVAGAGLLLLWQKGYTKVYLNVHEYPLWWLPLSLGIALLLHETYYYWLHRWMHRPKVFRLLHKVHHDSNITSPWTAFSFHPLEGVLQAIFLPALLLFLPMHLYVVLTQLTIMTFSSVINHLDIEVYPRGAPGRFFGRFLIGATHHSLHHKQFRYNYGLYFTFWDKWKRTESPLYASLYEEKRGVKAQAPARTGGKSK